MPEPTPEQAAADAALALEVLSRFLSHQIAVGAVEAESVARLLAASAQAVGQAEPALATRAELSAHRLISELPAGGLAGGTWGGDPDWIEPA